MFEIRAFLGNKDEIDLLSSFLYGKICSKNIKDEIYILTYNENDFSAEANVLFEEGKIDFTRFINIIETTMSK